jgi:hypothetical protein
MSNYIRQQASIFVAGHRGLAGSAIVRKLRALGYENLLLRTRQELDLEDSAAVDRFFASSVRSSSFSPRPRSAAFWPTAISPPNLSPAICESNPM